MSISRRLPFSRPKLALLLAWPLALSLAGGRSITLYYFVTHDRQFFVLLLLALLGLTFFVPRGAVPDLALRRWPVIGGLAVLVLALWWGTYALMANYPLSRDEHMVLFDMAVFAKGHLIEPLASVWRDNPQALVPDFLMNVPGNEGLISSYLPGNAMLRLAFAQVADPALMNPLLAAIGAFALFDLAQRQFGQDRRAIVVTMVLFLGSSQLLVTAMTVYAMTAHTALNLVWLMLFMRGGKLGHSLAIGIGFLAMGLHQVVFHPLFMAPFLLWVLVQRRYSLCATYIAAYAVGGIFWILYPAIAVSSAGISASGGAGESVSFFRDRVWPLLVERDRTTLALMSFNLFRFAVWNHLALIPLCAAAWPLIRRNSGIAAPLAGGIILTVVFCGLILPMQGHGWGYRYVAGLLGNFALLGGMGYRQWAARDRASADGVVIALSVLTVVFVAANLVSAYRFVGPHARLDRLLSASKADMVLLDTEWPSQAIDEVRNLPDLSNRPLRLSSRAMTAAQIGEVCDRGTIEIVTRDDLFRAGIERETPVASPKFEKKVADALAGRACMLGRLKPAQGV